LEGCWSGDDRDGDRRCDSKSDLIERTGDEIAQQCLKAVREQVLRGGEDFVKKAMRYSIFGFLIIGGLRRLNRECRK
jgi:hypothetical protein